eukprot:Em0017g439a
MEDPDHDSDIMPLMSANPEDNTQQPATGYDIGSPYLPPEYTEEPIRLQYPSSTNWSDICFAPTSQQPTFVQWQPPSPVTTTTLGQHFTGENCVSLSITMTLVALILGGWPSLVCTVSALVIAYSGRDDERRGNTVSARSKANVSLGLNVAAVIFAIVVWAAVVAIAVSASAPSAAQHFATPYTTANPPTTGRQTTATPYCYSSQYYCRQSTCISTNINYYCYYFSYYSYSDASYYSYYQAVHCYVSYQKTDVC